MSNPAALATVTATLQHLLSGVASAVTTKPPSTARNGTGEQLNIFLYSTHHNPAFSNAPIPGTTHNGEHGNPPLSLILKYMITAYGASDDDISGQQLMGQAMSILHDHPVLGPSDITGITPDSGLQHQIERIRITPDTLSLDDMSKLWTSFQSAEYRLSTGYEVSVVMIESTRPSRTPLPVLTLGSDDRGAYVFAGPSPSISGLRYVNQKPAAELGDIVTLLGSQLSSDDALVRFEHPLLDAGIDVPPEVNQDGAELQVQLPTYADDVALGSKWPPGFYTLSLVIERDNSPDSISNRVAMGLSPTIESISPASAPAGDVVFTIECLPQIRDEQEAYLLFGNRIVAADSVNTPADPTANTTLTFTVADAQASAPYVLRLRVDGVDSIAVDFSSGTPQFDSNQQVIIT